MAKGFSGKNAIGKTMRYKMITDILMTAALLQLMSYGLLGEAYHEWIGVVMSARSVHMICAYWGFVLMSFHLGLHWSMIIGIVGKLWKKPPEICTWVARIAGAAAAGYGIYAFKKRAIGTYMLLRAHFVFFDYEEPFFLFLLDELAVMGLFVFLGHYAGKGLKHWNKNDREMRRNVL